MKPIANTFIIIMLMITICQVTWAQSATEDFKKGHDFFKDKNYIEAVEWFRKAAEQGLVEAQFDLAVCYASGDGVTKSYEEAATWFRKAAEQGHSTAQLFLGIGYWKGEGLPQNMDEANNWLGKAAEQGNEMAKQALEQLQKELK